MRSIPNSLKLPPGAETDALYYVVPNTLKLPPGAPYHWQAQRMTFKLPDLHSPPPTHAK